MVLSGTGVEYWFTDVGRSFVLAAEERAAGSQGMRFKVLDITRDPAAQGFPLGSFDAVFGANVVHATPRIEETLGHLRSLLAPGGLLGLVETVRRQRWADLVWGLTEGWWSFTDAPLRTESPLLSAAAWQEVLGRAGFAEAQAWPCGDVETALLLAVRGDSAGVDGIPMVFLTRDPAALPALAAQAEDHTRRTDTFATAILLEGEGDLLLALDRAQAGGLTQLAVSGSPVIPIPAPAADPSPVPQAVQSPSSTALHGRPHLMTPYVAPRTDEEHAIAEIWQKALGIDRVGVNDNFLELGGDSLIGLQVVYAVQNRFSLADRTLNLYERSTVAAAARFVAAGAAGAEDDPFALRSTRGEQRRERRGSFKRMKP